MPPAIAERRCVQSKACGGGGSREAKLRRIESSFVQLLLRRLPPGYSGAGLRCAPLEAQGESEKLLVDGARGSQGLSRRGSSGQEEPKPFKWLLLRPRGGAGESDSNASWFLTIDSTVVAFRRKHVCSLAVVFTQHRQTHTANAPAKPINYVRSLFLKALP